MTAEKITDLVRDHLEGLGNTGDEVADSLRKTGCRGVPENCSECPVAVSVRSILPIEWGRVEVTDEQIILSDARGKPYYCPLPRPVEEFVHALDLCIDYHDLELTEE